MPEALDEIQMILGNLYREKNIFTENWTVRFYTFLTVLKQFWGLMLWPKELYMERATVNFIGRSVTAADNSGSARTDVTISDFPVVHALHVVNQMGIWTRSKILADIMQRRRHLLNISFNGRVHRYYPWLLARPPSCRQRIMRSIKITAAALHRD